MRSVPDAWLAMLIFLPFTGYLQYRLVRDFWPELTRTLKTRKIRGYLVGAVGIFFFFLSIQILILMPWSTSGLQHWGGLTVLGTIVLTVIGFLIGNQTVARIAKKYTRRVTTSNDRQSP
jgi:uncharacterized membrane protein